MSLLGTIIACSGSADSLDGWGASFLKQDLTNATSAVEVSAEFSTSSPIVLDKMADAGLSSRGCAFAFAWYGDSRRLFALLDKLVSKGQKASDLRFSSECEFWTTDDEAPDFSLLHVAAIRGHTNLVRTLVGRYGLSPNDSGASGSAPSPLSLLLERDSKRFETQWTSPNAFIDMALLLLELGARPQNQRGFAEAIWSRDPRLLEAMLKASPDLKTILDPYFNPPLVHYVDPDNDQALALLIRYGVDVHAPDYMGKTIFDWARGDPKLAAQLKRFGLLVPSEEQANQVKSVTNLVPVSDSPAEP